MEEGAPANLGGVGGFEDREACSVKGRGVRGGRPPSWQLRPAGSQVAVLTTVSQEPCSPAELCPLLAQISGAGNTGRARSRSLLQFWKTPARARLWGVVSRPLGARPVTATALPAETVPERGQTSHQSPTLAGGVGSTQGRVTYPGGNCLITKRSQAPTYPSKPPGSATALTNPHGF